MPSAEEEDLYKQVAQEDLHQGQMAQRQDEQIAQQELQQMHQMQDLQLMQQILAK